MNGFLHGACGVVGTATVLFGLLGGCSLLLDLDPVAGHPCDDAGACLEGYVCRQGLCVRPNGLDGGSDGGSDSDGGDGGSDGGGGGDVTCFGRLCASGEVCVEGVGCSEAQPGVLGAVCTADADCATALATCSDGTAKCLCLRPSVIPSAASASPPGLCVALPSEPGDCAACEDAECVDVDFTSGGPNGEPMRRKLCLAKGRISCLRAADCRGGDVDLECVYYGWAEDPAYGTLIEPQLGFVGLCVTPVGIRSEGEACGAGEDCRSGLCQPRVGGDWVCSAACRTAADCLEACVGGNVGLLGDAATYYVYDVAPVCGGSLSLGAPCTPYDPMDPYSLAPECGADAPYCTLNPSTQSTVCAVACFDDFDCALPTVCDQSTALCLAP